MNVQKLSSIKNSLVESNVQPTSKKISEKKLFQVETNHIFKRHEVVTFLLKSGDDFVEFEIEFRGERVVGVKGNHKEMSIKGVLLFPFHHLIVEPLDAMLVLCLHRHTMFSVVFVLSGTYI